ncbi:MAG: hypothetical protein ACE5HI_00730 [bacterium]
MKEGILLSCVGLLLIIFCSSVSLAQQDNELPNPGQLGYLKIQQGKKYFSVLIEFRELEPQYVASKWKNSFYEFMATINSYMGNYPEALSYFDKRRRQSDYPPDFHSCLDKYKPFSALKVIQSLADSHQVIFINEAHHVPIHRAFSIRLLKILYDKGFRYFAAETLNEIDTELNHRKYPLLQITGFYTDEPVYGDLVRTALKLGFKVIAYEHTVPCNPRKDDNSDCQNQRERGQAQNLFDRILAKDPSAKILVHAGYGHIDERGNNNWIPMAKYFKEITKIDPFTIDQQTMTEHSTPEYEQADYRYAVEKGLVKEPTIFRSDGGGLWVQKFIRGQYDVQVFHPRSQYKNGRPDWLLLGGARKPYQLAPDICAGSTPCLVQAFIYNEDSNAVPIDQIEISNTKEIPTLMLPEGKIRIQALDKTGKIIKDFVTIQSVIP